MPIDETVSRRSVWNDGRLIDDAGRRHVERLEDPVLEKVAVEFTGNPVNENAEGQKTQIAVAPARARRVSRWDGFDNPEELVFGVVLTEVEVIGIIGESRGMAEQFAH